MRYMLWDLLQWLLYLPCIINPNMLYSASRRMEWNIQWIKYQKSGFSYISLHIFHIFDDLPNVGDTHMCVADWELRRKVLPN